MWNLENWLVPRDPPFRVSITYCRCFNNPANRRVCRKTIIFYKKRRYRKNEKKYSRRFHGILRSSGTSEIISINSTISTCSTESTYYIGNSILWNWWQWWVNFVPPILLVLQIPRNRPGRAAGPVTTQAMSSWPSTFAHFHVSFFYFSSLMVGKNEGYEEEGWGKNINGVIFDWGNRLRK